MNRLDRTDGLIAAFFDQQQPELPDRVLDAVRADIHRTRQRPAIRPFGVPAGWTSRGILVAAAVIVAAAVAWIGFTQNGGIGGVPANTGPGPSPSARSTDHSKELASPARAAVFTSPLYGYTLVVPAGWATSATVLRWDGVVQPAFGEVNADAYRGPADLAMMAYAGPFEGDLQALVDDRIAATARDHSGDCPSDALQVNEPIEIAGQAGMLLGWNCGALINQALTIRDGIAYAFGFRDLGIKAARDPTDLTIFRSVLDSVELPATPSPSR